MRKQAGSRNRGWLPAIRRRLESYGGHVGNRLSVAAGVALAAGLLAALAPRAEAVSATGGNYTNDIPGYRVHVFTNSATASNFVVSAASSGDTIDVLVVAGGGGGGGYIGGGGGGGGVLYSNSLSVSAVQYSIGVGIGGVGGTSISSAGGTAVGTRGGSSYFSNTVSGASITATGGGYGGGYDDQPGYTAPSIGGSGGGGCHGDSGLAKNGAAGISGQGYAGGNGTWASAYNAGGGGGAGTSGWSGTSTTGGTGGVGRVVDVTGTSVYYGGGGGGGGNAGNSAGPGGLGGGGAGSVTANGQDGTNSFGGGGGGGGQTFKNGGAGGSGIVIVRYSTAPTITVVPSGTLDFGQPLVNTTNTLTNTVSGANLANDITVTVTPYPEYQISTNNVDFTNTYTLVHTGGAVPTTTNYVRFSSAVVGLHPGAITNISGSVTQAVTLAADVALAAAPTLYRSPIQLPFGNVITNKSSTNNYTLWGSNLTANVSVTAPSSFFKLSTDNATFTSDPLNLTTNADGSLSSTTIYVQFTPTNGQAYDGSITNSSAGAENKMVSLAGTGVVQTLYVSAGSLNFGNVITNTTSNLTYTVSGSNLEADVTLTVSGGTGFTIRTNGGSFGTSVTLTVPNKTQLAGGTLAAQTIVVQFAPTAVQTYSSVTITASSVGAANQTTALSGTGVNPPATVSITAPTANQMFNLGDAVSLTATAVPGTPSYWVAIYTNRASGTYGLATSQSGAGPAFTVSLGSSLAAGTYHVYATVTDSVNSVTYTSAVSAFIVQPAVQSPMLASGGDVIWTYTNYAGTASQTVYGVHQYTNADVAAFVPNAGLTNVDYLVVGGGGGGGAEGGGGGGGGLVKTGTVAVSAQAYSVVVGAGGLAGANGSTSIFHTVSALGGGAGALPGASYGNGGGGGGCWGANDAARAGGTGTGGGNSGGNGNGPDLGFPGAGGGGGGSAVGANGQNAPFNGQGGYGGAGIASAITGISTNYGGGGGGGVRANNTPTGGGAGGAGGGGAGGCSTSPYNGTAGSVNTGGGGGGAGGDQMGHSGSGANGGSGVVIVRYVIPPPPRGTVIMMR